MTTTVNNTIENTNVVANNVANNEGYNSNITNEVIVLNGDTFYRKNMVEGQKYRYEKHYFVIDKFEMRGTHLYYCGTLDNKPFEGDLHSLKVACECTERRPKNGSANDTENGKAVKVKRTSKETADQIKAKYADTIKAVCDKVSKLQDDDRILGALNLLCTIINNVASERIENVTNAERNAYLANVARREEIKQTLETNKFRLARAIDNDDDEQIMEIGKNNKELKAELLLLEQKITAYEAEQSASEATENEEMK